MRKSCDDVPLRKSDDALGDGGREEKKHPDHRTGETCRLTTAFKMRRRARKGGKME